AVGQPAAVDGANGVAEDGAGHAQATLGGINRDMQRQGTHARGDGKNHYQAGQPGVERIDRDNQDRTAAALFVPESRVQIRRPYLAALRSGDAAHGAAPPSSVQRSFGSSPSMSVLSHNFRSASTSAQAAGSALR